MLDLDEFLSQDSEVYRATLKCSYPTTSKAAKLQCFSGQTTAMASSMDYRRRETKRRDLGSCTLSTAHKLISRSSNDLIRGCLPSTLLTFGTLRASIPGSSIVLRFAVMTPFSMQNDTNFLMMILLLSMLRECTCEGKG